MSSEEPPVAQITPVSHDVSGIPGAIVVKQVGPGFVGISSRANSAADIQVPQGDFSDFLSHVQSGGDPTTHEGVLRVDEHPDGSYAFFTLRRPASALPVDLRDLEIFTLGARRGIFDSVSTRPPRAPRSAGQRRKISGNTRDSRAHPLA